MGFTVRDGAPMWHQLSSGDREYYTERSRRENRENTEELARLRGGGADLSYPPAYGPLGATDPYDSRRVAYVTTVKILR